MTKRYKGTNRINKINEECEGQNTKEIIFLSNPAVSLQ